MELRPYQTAAIEAVKHEFDDLDVQSTLLVAATGTGKTVIATNLLKYYRQKLNKPTLTLAHRQELIDQISNTVYKNGMIPRIEKAEQSAVGQYADVVVASVQSITQQRRLDRFNPDHFGLIWTDEAHHATSPTYRRVYDYFRPALHLGVTATPSRHDEVGLKNIFETCAYQYSIKDAIEDGFLVPIRGMQVQVNGIHLEDLKIVAGEFAQDQMDAMLRDEETLQSMVLPTFEHAGDRPTIIFTPGVEHAHEIAGCFNRQRPGCAVAVDGGMHPDDRRDRLRKYESGQAQFLVNVGIATEGYDHPPTACIALFRPTKSLGLFAQMIGRGTRLSEGKSDCLVLDFVGVNNTVRTITVMDVLDGSVLSDAEHKKALEIQGGGGGDALEALGKAKQFVAGLDSIKAKMRALSTANAWDVLAMFALPSVKGKYGGDKATPKQIELLKNRGILIPPGLEKGEAMQLISKLFERQDAQLATFKQLKYLKALGYQDSAMENISFHQASELINQLASKRSFARVGR